MAEAMTFSEMMERDGAQEGLDNLVEALEADSVTMKLLDAAKTIEDMYEVSKKYIRLKFEDFKKVFQMAVDYFSSPKAALADEVLDDVVGGWSLSSIYDSLSQKAKCIAGCIAGGLMIAGGVLVGGTCIALGGPIGVAGGLAVGAAGIGFGVNMIVNAVKG